MPKARATSRFISRLRDLTFWRDECGGVTIEHVVMMGGAVGLAIAVMANYSDGAKTLAKDRQTSMAGYKRISSSSTPPVAPAAVVTSPDGTAPTN